MKTYYNILLLSIMLLFNACDFISLICIDLNFDKNIDISRRMNYKNTNIIMDIELNKLRIDDNTSFVFSEIFIKNVSNHKIITFNLNNVIMMINRQVSDGIYIAAPVHIFIKSENLKENEIIKKEIYWTFKKKFTKEEIENSHIQIKYH